MVGFRGGAIPPISVLHPVPEQEEEPVPVEEQSPADAIQWLESSLQDRQVAARVGHARKYPR
jgi:hypothetical protein